MQESPYVQGANWEVGWKEWESKDWEWDNGKGCTWDDGKGRACDDGKGRMWDDGNGGGGGKGGIDNSVWFNTYVAINVFNGNLPIFGDGFRRVLGKNSPL